MNELVYPRERTLGTITLVLGLLIWLVLIIGTMGIALLFLAVSFVIYLFAQSALIAHIKGDGVELSETQFPDLYAQFSACCDRLQIKTRPKVYILNGGGVLNAFATKFLGTQYVVLMSDVVDAMDKHPDGVRFYMGHELGHLRMNHLSGHLLRWPVLWLPLLGAAYSRACESTCDRHGRACSSSPENAARALAALSTGGKRWEQLDGATYLRQVNDSSGFWMSFHELIAAYPWLSKRVARVMNPDAKMPSRNALAYFFALFIPYAGRLGAGMGFLIMVYIIAALVAVALPAYQDNTVKAKINATIIDTKSTLDALSNYYATHDEMPESLESVGIASQLPDGTPLQFDPEYMELTVNTKQGDLIFMSSTDDQDRIIWSCTNGEGLKPTQIPATCENIE